MSEKMFCWCHLSGTQSTAGRNNNNAKHSRNASNGRKRATTGTPTTAKFKQIAGMLATAGTTATAKFQKTAGMLATAGKPATAKFKQTAGVLATEGNASNS
jgi:hypothetical protein